MDAKAGDMGNLAFLLVDKTRYSWRPATSGATSMLRCPASFPCAQPATATPASSTPSTPMPSPACWAPPARSRAVSGRASYPTNAISPTATRPAPSCCPACAPRATKGDAEGEPSDDEYERRLTFVYAPVGDDWLIVHMHSSAPHAPDDPFASRRMTARDVGAVDLDAVLSQAKVERERYEIVSELSDDVIYEYDVGRDTLYLFSTRFGKSPDIRRNKLVIEHCLDTIGLDGFVHPDDRVRYAADARKLSQAQPERGDGRDDYVHVYRLRPMFFFGRESEQDVFVHQRVMGPPHLRCPGPGREVRGQDRGRVRGVRTAGAVLDRCADQGLQPLVPAGPPARVLRLQAARRVPTHAFWPTWTTSSRSTTSSATWWATTCSRRSWTPPARSSGRAISWRAWAATSSWCSCADVYDPRVAMERSEALIDAFRTMAADRGFPRDVSLSVGVVVESEPHRSPSCTVGPTSRSIGPRPRERTAPFPTWRAWRTPRAAPWRSRCPRWAIDAVFIEAPRVPFAAWYTFCSIPNPKRAGPPRGRLRKAITHGRLTSSGKTPHHRGAAHAGAHQAHPSGRQTRSATAWWRTSCARRSISTWTVTTVPRKTLDDKSERGSHQGVMAGDEAARLCGHHRDRTRRRGVRRGERGRALVVILDHLTDAGNLGAIARSAEAVGACGLVIPNKRSAKVDASTYKSSAGAHRTPARGTGAEPRAGHGAPQGARLLGGGRQRADRRRDLALEPEGQDRPRHGQRGGGPVPRGEGELRLPGEAAP